MNCTFCGYTTTELEALFCPNCGQMLGASQPTTPPVPKGRADDMIYHAPTRVPGGSFAEPPGWARGAATSPTQTPTNSRLYRAGILAGAPVAPPAAPPAARKRKRGLILASILALLVVFAGGLGVGFALFSAHGKPTAGTGNPSPTATRAPLPTTTPAEKVIFQEALAGPTNPWPTDGAHCRFQGGSYHILRDFICAAPVGVQIDFAISVQAKQVSGTAGLFYGYAFRFKDAYDFYLLRINSNSTWLFDKVVAGKVTAIVPDTASSAIKPGLNSANTLLVRAFGPHFDVFVNGSKVGEANDATFASGTLGLIGADNADIAFTNCQVATLT